MLSRRNFEQIEITDIINKTETVNNIKKRLKIFKKIINNPRKYEVVKKDLTKGLDIDILKNKLIEVRPTEEDKQFVFTTLLGFTLLNQNEINCVYYHLFCGISLTKLKNGCFYGDEYLIISNIYGHWNKVIENLLLSYLDNVVYK